MRLAKILAGVVLLLGIVAGVLYVLASAVPGDYRPADLTHRQRVRVAKRFIQRVVDDFHEPAERRRRFDVVLGEDEFNAYLASMDEIVAHLPGGDDGQVRRALAESQLADPSVAMSAGEIALLVRHTGYNKILTLRLRFELLDSGRLRVHLRGARVGRLPVPRFLVDRAVQALRTRAAGAIAPDERSNGGSLPTGQQMRRLTARIVLAIGGEPIVPVLGLRKHKRVRLTGMDLTDKAVVLHFIPAGPEE
ncbi:MAG: hypothetical protein KGY99_05185 [Phycisphaerae bacterium]|nr:hypothetical protein [Phycisphaerae bacterium]